MEKIIDLRSSEEKEMVIIFFIDKNIGNIIDFNIMDQEDFEKNKNYLEEETHKDCFTYLCLFDKGVLENNKIPLIVYNLENKAITYLDFHSEENINNEFLNLVSLYVSDFSNNKTDKDSIIEIQFKKCEHNCISFYN